MSDALFTALAASPAVPVLRAPTAARALDDARALIDAGFTTIELTFSTPDVVTVIRELSADPLVTIGAGTVLHPRQADDAAAAGADFLVSPVSARWFIEAAQALGVPTVPGCATPTEIATATDLGAPMVKVFPIGRLGGVAYVRDLLAPMPHLNLMVTGGVRAGEVRSYLNAGCVGVGLGSLLGADPDPRSAARAAIAQIGAPYGGRPR